MGWSAAMVVVAALSANEQRIAAKEQAALQRQAAERAQKQAAEAARANALAAQTASDRERAQAAVKANVELASEQETPTVELATAAPAEAARRRTVRASFNPDDGEGSIRL